MAIKTPDELPDAFPDRKWPPRDSPDRRERGEPLRPEPGADDSPRIRPIYDAPEPPPRPPRKPDPPPSKD